MREIEVFADVTCPFTHVGLQRLVADREARGRSDVVFRTRAWPLELVNGEPLQAEKVAEEIDALRASVAPELFAGFSPASFPRTTIPALRVVAAAYEVGVEEGERVALLLRTAVFEEGEDIGDTAVLARLVPEIRPAPGTPELDDLEEGRARGVVGSPHFFVDDQGFFCPSLDISHDESGFSVRFDQAEYERFTERVFG